MERRTCRQLRPVEGLEEEKADRREGKGGLRADVERARARRVGR